MTTKTKGKPNGNNNDPLNDFDFEAKERRSQTERERERAADLVVALSTLYVVYALFVCICRLLSPAGKLLQLNLDCTSIDFMRYR